MDVDADDSRAQRLRSLAQARKRRVELHLRARGIPAHPAVHEGLRPARLQRAIGVVYTPETELESHYLQTALPDQFDELVWFDETRAVGPIPVEASAPTPDPSDTYPFAV